MPIWVTDKFGSQTKENGNEHVGQQNRSRDRLRLAMRVTSPEPTSSLTAA